MENRDGLVVEGLVSRATGDAERLLAEVMVMRRRDHRRRITLGADKADFVATCAGFRVTPHVARNTSSRRSNIEDKVAASEGYQASMKARKRVEMLFA